MMEQYLEIKKQNPNHLLFFRLGDFYELFFEDAQIASKELELVLTGKDCGQEERAPMCGVPYHSADSYIAKLVERGYKVAVCEQTEDPKQSKTLVKREVIRVVTPGTVIDANMLDETKNNYIMCLYQDRQGFGMACADVSTGEFTAASFPQGDDKKVLDEIARFQPVEIIIHEGFENSAHIAAVCACSPFVYFERAFKTEAAFRTLTDHFHVLNLEGFGLEKGRKEINAAGALLAYLTDTQKNGLSHITTLKINTNLKYMILDSASRRNLELTETIRDKNKKNSLLGVLDRTKTATGARTLRRWIEQPLIRVNAIQKRLDAVEDFCQNAIDREELRELLHSILDIERIMTRIIYGTANGRDLAALRNSVRCFPALKELISVFNAPLLKEIHRNFDTLTDICQWIEEAIEDDPPFTVREGGIIKSGYNDELDRLREAKKNGAQWMTDLEATERKKTGIKNLKIRYNKIFGYCIELTNANKDAAPEYYIRRQTLSACERYVTEELKKIEEAILGADEKIVALEYDLFTALRDKVGAQIERIQLSAVMIGVLDALQSLGDAADKFHYCKPLIESDGAVSIIAGRHPVVEQVLDQPFVPNDTTLDLFEDRLAIITGPNMAGKSTYMRQTALIVLMAQIGSFVPAQSAHIGVVDRIFTRVGAADDLATGQSTFMVEMSEVANILNNATRSSLIILDEIGRGTSTFDGLSIAWAVLEHIADETKIGAKTLFATHYHELTELEGKVDGVKNYCVTVREQGDDIIFLRKITRGGADNSYGIQVARLAGLPRQVLDRSHEILDALSSADIVKTEPRAVFQEGFFRRKRRKAEYADNQIQLEE